MELYPALHSRCNAKGADNWSRLLRAVELPTPCAQQMLLFCLNILTIYTLSHEKPLHTRFRVGIVKCQYCLVQAALIVSRPTKKPNQNTLTGVFCRSYG